MPSKRFWKSLVLTIIIILISSHQSFTSADESTITNSVSFKGLFNRFSEFIKDLKNPNYQHNEIFIHRLQHYESELEQTQIWLTVSSVVNIIEHEDDRDDLLVRALELHWRRRDPPLPGDYLALHRVNDSIQIQKFPLVDHKTNKTFPRYYKTYLEFDYQNLTNLEAGNQNKDNCLKYFLIYVNKDGQVEAKNCIRMQSRWMEREFEIIKDRCLSELMLPGTHDASSYEKYIHDLYEHDVLNRFQYTQDESLYNQLAYGIRYMDWRVGVYNKTNYTDSHHYDLIEEFWMVHDIQRNHITLQQALSQVTKFLERTTLEIIIIDFHRFVHGFSGEKNLNILKRRLRAFIQLVQEQFGSYLIPYSPNGLPTIGDLVKQGKRVLVGYAYKFDVRQLPDSSLFWPPVQHLWANTDKFSELETYIGKQICKPEHYYHNKHRLRSVMAELTPTIEGVLFHRYHGLRELAALVNMHFEHWFRHQWWNCTNIVSVDFFLGSDIVEISLGVNRRRFHQSKGR